MAAIAIPRFVGTQASAKLSADQATARTIISALQLAEASGKNEDGTDVPANPTVANLVSGGFLLDTPEAQSVDGAGFFINYTTDPIQVHVGDDANGTKVYPVD